MSPTAAQMPRAVGLAYASVLYRHIPELAAFPQFSHRGNEVTWATIGNASTAEGLFWEAVNAIGVLKAPAIITIYDDGYGISVPNQFQMVKENISAILKGFERDPNAPPDKNEHGYDLYTVRAWDYPALLETYAAAAEIAREYHIPALVHVTEVTQPQGHSTSGSHERYKSPERLQWEAEFDCIRKMREWIVQNGVASEAELNTLEAEARERMEGLRKAAWRPIRRRSRPNGGNCSRFSMNSSPQPARGRTDAHPQQHFRPAELYPARFAHRRPRSPAPDAP